MLGVIFIPNTNIIEFFLAKINYIKKSSKGIRDTSYKTSPPYKFKQKHQHINTKQHWCLKRKTHFVIITARLDQYLPCSQLGLSYNHKEK